MPRSFHTQEVPRKLESRNKAHKQHKRNLRATITPGTVLILVAGRHKGKRVVFLKQLSSGLLLVTGPYKVNGCPLRRVNQIYVIATKTKVDISGVTLPERLNDSYFARQKLKRPRHTEGDIFESKKEEYSVSDVRKEDQVAVDKQLIAAIKKSADKQYLLQYLNAMFSLKNHEYPHKMAF